MTDSAPQTVPSVPTPTARRLAFVSLLEGISYLLLLLVAMPLKYVFDQPEAVRVVGSAHGALFVFFLIALLDHTLALKRSFKDAVLKGVWATFLVSVPLGAFVLHRELKRE